MKEILLPNYFKKIGLIAGSLCVVAFVILFGLLQNINSTVPLEIAMWIVKDLIFICLLFIAFAKEQKETEEIRKLRYEKLKRAVLFGGIILLFSSFSDLIFDFENIDQKSGYEIMVVVLLFYIATFNFEKSK